MKSLLTPILILLFGTILLILVSLLPQSGWVIMHKDLTTMRNLLSQTSLLGTTWDVKFIKSNINTWKSITYSFSWLERAQIKLSLKSIDSHTTRLRCDYGLYIWIYGWKSKNATSVVRNRSMMQFLGNTCKQTLEYFQKNN